MKISYEDCTNGMFEMFKGETITVTRTTYAEKTVALETKKYLFNVMESSRM